MIPPHIKGKGHTKINTHTFCMLRFFQVYNVKPSFLTHPCRRQPLCIKMVYNICWRSFLRGHDPVTITFWGFWLVIHLRWPEWCTRPESKGSWWNRNAVNSCTKNSDVTCPFRVFIVRTLFYFSDLCFLQ